MLFLTRREVRGVGRIRFSSSAAEGADTASSSVFNAKLGAVEQELEKLRVCLHIGAKEKEYKSLYAKAMEATAWKQQERLSELHKTIEGFTNLASTVSETKALYAMASEENDAGMKADCAASLEVIESVIKDQKLQALLSHQLDTSSCFMTIVAGAGGVDSRDWVTMLARMYSSWADKQSPKLTSEIVDTDHGDSSSTLPRSLTLKFAGKFPFAYGMLKCDAGVHRLVRISPFDPQGKRHTSFAQVLIYPVLEEGGSIGGAMAISNKDLKIDTFKSSGAGGQHVNTTESAIRITHLPTGLVVSIQNERSQHQNRAVAMQILRSRLWQREREQMHKLQKANTIGGEADNSFGGAHIRSYVLQPYTLVKDHRCGWETKDIDSFLAGDKSLLDECVLASLEQNHTHHSSASDSL